jgi:hypothetical protein
MLAAMTTSSRDQTADSIDRHIRAWLDRFVVDLNLCPFARPVVTSKALRIVVCSEADPQSIARAVMAELDLLQQSAETEIATTLLVFQDALTDFNDYLGVIETAEALLQELGLSGVIQLASFHPDYLFAGEAKEAVSHFTNRAPYPIIHFLREDMLSRALTHYVDPEQIPLRNIQTLESLGRDRIQQMLQALAR